jgi:hypothetical protein
MRDDILAEDPGRPGIRPQQRGQDPHDGGLAGTVRAEQAKHGALGNGKVDPGERRRLLELLHQSFN